MLAAYKQNTLFDFGYGIRRDRMFRYGFINHRKVRGFWGDRVGVDSDSCQSFLGT